MELAEKNPDVNYIGIERYSSVLLRGLQKRSQLELSNIYFMRIDALELADVFDAGEVDRIYLNFSDPWPKDRHAKRRLTSDRFLPIYDQILKKTASSNLKPTTRTCSSTPWSPFRKPDGRWMPIPSIFTTAKWRRGM